MATLAENKIALFNMRNNVGNHAKICNFKPQSQRGKYLLCQKHIFLKFENPRWQIKTFVASDQSLVRERYMMVKLSQLHENWKSFRNQGIINLS